MVLYRQNYNTTDISYSDLSTCTAVIHPLIPVYVLCQPCLSRASQLTIQCVLYAQWCNVGQSLRIQTFCSAVNTVSLSSMYHSLIGRVVPTMPEQSLTSHDPVPPVLSERDQHLQPPLPARACELTEGQCWLQHSLPVQCCLPAVQVHLRC